MRKWNRSYDVGILKHRPFFHKRNLHFLQPVRSKTIGIDYFKGRFLYITFQRMHGLTHNGHSNSVGSMNLNLVSNLSWMYAPYIIKTYFTQYITCCSLNLGDSTLHLVKSVTEGLRRHNCMHFAIGHNVLLHWIQTKLS